MKQEFLENLPIKFTQNVIELCNEEGKTWLQSLPKVIGELEEKWEIKFEKQFENLSYNFVASCIQKDKTPTVLKIALPLRNPEIFNEAKTLQIFDGKGVVQFLKLDKVNRAILLERLLPGRHLKEIYANGKESSVGKAIDLMRKLYQESPPQKSFTNVDYWLNELKIAEVAKESATYLKRARDFFEEINFDKSKLKFLHGDLHHENILSVGENDFLAIDPFGINANVGYEIGLFLRVHAKWVNDKKLLDNAVQKFADAFEMSPEEVKKWAYVQQVLSACWDFEENGKFWQRDLELADIFWKI
jgi:streptomycin 6-kinase